VINSPDSPDNDHHRVGPRTIEEANAYRADERLPIADLHKPTEVIALTLVDLLAE
jgi:succinyl-diaminopimelate desuccinylase